MYLFNNFNCLSLGAQPFLLAIYFTNNKFKTIDVSCRIDHMKSELKQREIALIGFGSDGDSRLFAAQKKMIEFGCVTLYGSLELCGNLYAECLGTQDSFHIFKRWKNLMNELSRLMRIGKHIITVNHLIIMYKKFHKIQHGLVEGDLDVTDSMNYEYVFF